MTYEYTHSPDRKIGLALSFSCFMPSILLLLINHGNPLIQSTLRAISIFLFAAGLCIFVRFVLCTFTYRLENGDFTVICRTGKRIRTVCRVSFDTLCEIRELSKETRPLIKKQRRAARRSYFYCSDIFGKGRYCLFLDDGDGVCCVKLCPDAVMARMIREICEKNTARANN